MDIKIENFYKKALDKMFQAVGFKGFNKTFTKKYEDWYQRKAWTQKQENEYKAWFIKEYCKDLNAKKFYAEKQWAWFNLCYGWKNAE